MPTSCLCPTVNDSSAAKSTAAARSVKRTATGKLQLQLLDDLNQVSAADLRGDDAAQARPFVGRHVEEVSGPDCFEIVVDRLADP